MASGVREEAVGFAARHIKRNPDITMGELKSLAAKEKLNIYPLIIGLARTRLGMGPKAGRPAGKRGPGRPPGLPGRPRGRPPGRRGPGRPRRDSGDPAAALQNVVSHVRDLEREVSDLKSALAKIADLAGG